MRYDTVIDQSNIFETIKNLLYYFVNNNILLLFIIIIFISLNIKIIYNNLKVNKISIFKYDELFLINFLIIIFFIYTLLVAAEEISSDKMFPGIILRNNYIYIIFIFFLLTNKEIIKNNINLLFIFFNFIIFY